jgi:hypothetical protein
MLSPASYRNALFKTDILIATRETHIVDPDSREREHFAVGQLKLLNEDLLVEDLAVIIDDPPGRFG